jgi:UDP-N-acetylglucosamine transferase subunit ALG13
VIFLTVGHQMPFDRLVRAVDEWARRCERADVFAQIGEGEYWPSAFPAAPFLTPLQFQQRMEQASAIVSHAGTGTIIAALQLGKPLLVLPRRADLGETRNDHQRATADHFGANGQILVAPDEDALVAMMDDLQTFEPPGSLGRDASPELLQRINAFIREAG